MAEKFKLLSWNTSGVFTKDQIDGEHDYIKECLAADEADVIFLAEAEHNEIGEKLSVMLKTLGYTSIAEARTTDRNRDVHAVKKGADIINVIAWRDNVREEDVEIIKLGNRSGFSVDLSYGLPAVFTHFDDWSASSRHEMAHDLLFQFGLSKTPLVVAADMNASDPRVTTPAQRLFSSAPYRFVSERIADLPLPEAAHRPVNIVRRFGEIASDNLIEYFAEHGLESVLPPQPTFDARHAGGFGRGFQLGIDNILARPHNYYTVGTGGVGSLNQQPDQLDHTRVSAIVEL